MATCTPPATLSPGFLYIKYTHQGLVTHTARWAFIDGVDIADTVNLRAEANRIAISMRAAVPPSFSLTDWGILNRDGSLFYEEPFTSPIAGTHGTVAGSDDYFSRTITFTGHGLAPAPGVCAGPSRSVLFVGNGYHFNVGQKRISAAVDTGLLAYWTALNTSTYLPADDYGQQFPFRGSGTVQFNAHTQRREGT